MDSAHIHLMITHLAIFGSLLGAFVMIHALWTKSPSTKIAAYNLFILGSLGGVIAYQTGEGAEEKVEQIPGVAENLIGQHEDFALFALVALIILGIVSLAGILITVRKHPLTKPIAILTLFFGLTGFGMAARTGYLGGQIRHTEINSVTTIPQQVAEPNEEEEDD